MARPVGWWTERHSWPALPGGVYYTKTPSGNLGLTVYIPKCGDKTATKVDFRFSRYADFEDCMIAAMSYQQEEWLVLFGCKPPKEKMVKRKGGDAGVHYYIDKKMLKDGHVRELHYWTASWREGKRSRLKKYSILKNGYEGARRLARAKRKEMVGDD